MKRMVTQRKSVRLGPFLAVVEEEVPASRRKRERDLRSPSWAADEAAAVGEELCVAKHGFADTKRLSLTDQRSQTNFSGVYHRIEGISASTTIFSCKANGCLMLFSPKSWDIVRSGKTVATFLYSSAGGVSVWRQGSSVSWNRKARKQQEWQFKIVDMDA